MWPLPSATPCSIRLCGEKMEEYRIKDGKKLRLGYTTGSCAAAAAKAAAWMLLTGQRKERIQIQTPKGIALDLQVLDIQTEPGRVSCAIEKDGGDDPDVTKGMHITATVAPREEPGIRIEGGEGVGRVTKPGLDQPVGNTAINAVPRRMIRENLEEVVRIADYHGGLDVVISAPGGEEVAKKTFNPRLGIVGGISILGTTGIVEPMSEEALVGSILVEMRQKAASGNSYLLVTPGNYGEAFLREHMTLPFSESVKCSNFVGRTIDMAVELGVKGVLFVAHIGKFVKVAAGIMNTHSRWADGRGEILAANALRAGISRTGALEVLEAATTEEALAVIIREGLLEAVMEQLTTRIHDHLHHRAGADILLGAVLYSNQWGYLGQTESAEELTRLLNNQYKGKEECGT